MINLPNYLPMLDHIKSLFPDNNTLQPEREWIINWATRIEVLRVQLLGNAVSSELIGSLQADLPTLQEIIVRLNQTPNQSSDVTAFHQQVESFYQALSSIDGQIDAELTKQWQNEINETSESSDAAQSYGVESPPSFDAPVVEPDDDSMFHDLFDDDW